MQYKLLSVPIYGNVIFFIIPYTKHSQNGQNCLVQMVYLVQVLFQIISKPLQICEI